MKNIIAFFKTILPYCATIGIIALAIWSFTEKSSHRSYNPHYGDESEYASEQSEETDDCGFDNGTYEADVDYYNPKTGYSKLYVLDVDVEDCEVIQINFPKGGYLDDSHISPAEIDENGYASVEDDQGRTFEVHIEE